MINRQLVNGYKTIVCHWKFKNKQHAKKRWLELCETLSGFKLLFAALNIWNNVTIEYYSTHNEACIRYWWTCTHIHTNCSYSIEQMWQGCTNKHIVNAKKLEEDPKEINSLSTSNKANFHNTDFVKKQHFLFWAPNNPQAYEWLLYTKQVMFCVV